MRDYRELVRYGIAALIAFIILYHTWFFFMGALAIIGVVYVFRDYFRR